MLTVGEVLAELADRGFSGPALVLEEEGVEVSSELAPPGVAVHVLHKPLEMQQVFRSVASALEG